MPVTATGGGRWSDSPAGPLSRFRLTKVNPRARTVSSSRTILSELISLAKNPPQGMNAGWLKLMITVHMAENLWMVKDL